MKFVLFMVGRRVRVKLQTCAIKITILSYDIPVQAPKEKISFYWSEKPRTGAIFAEEVTSILLSAFFLTCLLYYCLHDQRCFYERSFFVRVQMSTKMRCWILPEGKQVVACAPNMLSHVWLLTHVCCYKTRRERSADAERNSWHIFTRGSRWRMRQRCKWLTTCVSQMCDNCMLLKRFQC